MSVADLVRQFDKRDAALDAPETARARKSALHRFDQLGLPTKRLENWHYTDLSVLGSKGFGLIPPAPDSPIVDAARALLEGQPQVGNGSRYVFVDGHHSEPLSTPDDAPGIEIDPVASLSAADDGDSALAALNTAFAGGAASLRVTGSIAQPIEIVFVGSGRRLAPQVRLRIDLEKGAEATVVQRFIDLSDSEEAWLNLVTDIEQDEGSRLSLYRLQGHGPRNYQTTLNRARLAKDATIIAGSVEIGGQLTRNELEIALTGEGAKAVVYGIAITRGDTHCDTRIAIDHRAPRTTSRQDYRAIVADTSRSVFNGKVIVQEDAQHIDARQRNDNLLLSAKAEVDTKPELEIYADQVVCSHGATVGELDEDQLFYLRCRGIDAESAKSILTTAFAHVILNRIELEGLRQQAQGAVLAHLPNQLRRADPAS